MSETDGGRGHGGVTVAPGREPVAANCGEGNLMETMRAAGDRLSRAKASLLRPAQAGLGELVSELEECCRLFGTAGCGREGIARSMAESGAPVTEAAAAWWRELREVTLLVEGARGYCAGLVALRGEGHGYAEDGSARMAGSVARSLAGTRLGQRG